MYDSTLKRGPALFGISWDGGQASKRRSYTPIIISVGNTDSASSDTCFCIGYLPTLGSSDADARRILVQRCIGSILEVVDMSSERGFTCILVDEKGCEQPDDRGHTDGRRSTDTGIRTASNLCPTSQVRGQLANNISHAIGGRAGAHQEEAWDYFREQRRGRAREWAPGAIPGI